MSISASSFQKRLLTWFDLHGRKQLPWQHQKTPYRVWVSEIMLQQTQVNTVISYFQRFMQRFPDLTTLAEAKEDEVLHLWTGLGYYSRARNLHRSAQVVRHQFNGELPNNIDELQTLPGIGRSTAGAISSIAFNQPAAILDGNVKRVLTRIHGITQPVNEKETEKKLWALAEHYTPANRTADYTQAMMDLGATCCTRSKPQCPQCPFLEDCAARQQGITDQIPKRKSAKALPVHSATFLILKNQDKVLLCKRPPTGIWGGLWSFPEIKNPPDDSKTIRAFCLQSLKIAVTDYQALTPFRHTFSHYHLNIYPIVIPIKRIPLKTMEADQQIWYNLANPEHIGLPKPVQLIMSTINDTTDTMHQATKRS